MDRGRKVQTGRQGGEAVRRRTDGRLSCPGCTSWRARRATARSRLHASAAARAESTLRAKHTNVSGSCATHRCEIKMCCAAQQNTQNVNESRARRRERAQSE
eukprot:5296321-Pleurochrysis_carterae.AAC.1